jgi:hypothetical protein
MTLSELQSEVQRRIGNLVKQRDDLQKQLASVEHEIAQVSGANGIDAGLNGTGGASSKRMSARDYQEAVLEVLSPGQTYSTTEICEALLEAGYNAKKTTMSQRMAGHLVEVGVLRDQGKEGRANQYILGGAEQ